MDVVIRSVDDLYSTLMHTHGVFQKVQSSTQL